MRFSKHSADQLEVNFNNVSFLIKKTKNRWRQIILLLANFVVIYCCFMRNDIITWAWWLSIGIQFRRGQICNGL